MNSFYNHTVPERIIQRTQYYPSGLPWYESTGQQQQQRKYNGKEWIEAHGYDNYDYGARNYYPAIMRFTTIDPLAEKYYSVSPYVYCLNNPIRFIDPDGNDGWDVVKGAIVAIADNAALGQTSNRENMSYNNGNHYNLGQDIGDAVSMVLGSIETVGGSTIAGGGATVTVASSGTLAIAGVPTTAKGVVIAAHGASMTGVSAKNLMSQKGRVSEKSIPKSQLGPSGKPKIHTVKKPTLKRAKDAARNNPKSNTKAVKHASDKGQKTHYHPTRNGKKMKGKDNIHYEDSSSKRKLN